MTAYTVEITEVKVLYIREAASPADAEEQALSWAEADAIGNVRVSSNAIEADEHQRESADQEVTDTPEAEFIPW